MTSQTAMTDLPDGALLGGKYRIEKLLGAGGMGAVYLAENVDIGRKVAIKVLHPNFASDAGVLHRFRLEARAAAAIGHPGIVDVLDLGTTETGAEFIVMERLDGETLGGRIRRQGYMRADELIPLVCEVLDALAVAHEKGVVHRDLKPENIFLCARPVARAKILDFGISKFAGTEDVSLTRTGSIMGSPMYMSPEQARGAKQVGASTDLYAVGAILYEGLSGKPPFTGESYNEVIANLLMEPHTPLTQVRPDIPAAVAAIVDRLLAKDPALRIASAAETRSELRRALDPAATDVDMSAPRLTAVDGLAGTMAPTDPMLGPTMPPTSPDFGTQKTMAPSGASAATVPSTEPAASIQHRQKRTAMIAAAAVAVIGIGVGTAWFMTRGSSKTVANAPAEPAAAASSSTTPTQPAAPAAAVAPPPTGSATGSSTAATETAPAAPAGSATTAGSAATSTEKAVVTSRPKRPPGDTTKTTPPTTTTTTTKPKDKGLTIDQENPYP